MSRGLSNPTITVNDQVISIAPNSVSFMEGSGTRTFRTQSAGGGAQDIVASEDVSTKIAEVKFALLATTENFNMVSLWLQQSQTAEGNVVKLVDQEFTRVFNRAKIAEEPERSIGDAGQVEITFMSNPTA